MIRLAFVTAKSRDDALVVGQHLSVLGRLPDASLEVYSIEPYAVEPGARAGRVTYWRTGRRRSYWFAVARQTLAVRRCMKRGDADVVWARSLLAAGAFLLPLTGSRGRRQPALIYDPRGLLALELPGGHVRRKALDYLDRRATRRADAVIATTDTMESVLRARGARAVWRVDNVRSVGAMSRPDDPAGLRAVYLGSRESWHAEDAVVAWIAWMRRTVPDLRTVLIVRGAAGRPNDRFESAFDEVLYDLELEEVKQVLSTCTIGLSMILPTAAKVICGSPVKVFDYLAAGLHVIANWDLPEHGRLLQGGTVGALVPLDPAALAPAHQRSLESQCREGFRRRAAGEFPHLSPAVRACEVNGLMVDLLATHIGSSKTPSGAVRDA